MKVGGNNFRLSDNMFGGTLSSWMVNPEKCMVNCRTTFSPGLSFVEKIIERRWLTDDFLLEFPLIWGKESILGVDKHKRCSLYFLPNRTVHPREVVFIFSADTTDFWDITEKEFYNIVNSAISNLINRTVAVGVGSEFPFLKNLRRARELAALSPVLSQETRYHEDVLAV